MQRMGRASSLSLPLLPLQPSARSLLRPTSRSLHAHSSTTLRIPQSFLSTSKCNSTIYRRSPLLPPSSSSFNNYTHYSTNSNSNNNNNNIPPRFRKTKLLLTGTTLAFSSGYAYLFLDEYLHPSTRPKVFGDRPLPTSTWRPDSADAAFKSKPFLELLNDYIVFQICQIPGIVTITPYLLNAFSTIKLDAPIYWIVKHTFFAHFCGGEDAQEVVPTMQKFKNGNVGSIVDLSIEADMETGKEGGAGPSLSDLTSHSEKVTNLLKESVDIASMEPESFIAVKVTAVAPPFLLKKLTDMFTTLQKSFNSIDADKDGRVSLQEFRQVVASLPGGSKLSNNQVNELFTAMDKDKDGEIDWIDFSDGFTYLTPHRLLPTSPSLNTIAKTLFSSTDASTNADLSLSSSDIQLLDHVMHQMDSLCHHAESKKVRIMIDAEQTYFQPAIDHIALTLSKAYNSPTTTSNDSVIFNTYQMYLKDAYPRLLIDFERSKRNNYHFGAKLVRGAYMFSERARAQELGYEDPINPSLEATHSSYDGGVEFLLRRLSESKASSQSLKAKFVVASHNKSSILSTTQLMDSLGLNPRDGDIYFAQLMGMQDAVTYGLAANGYKAYKYLPYGPVPKVMPYLLRRAQENSALLGSQGAKEDIAGIAYELKRRILPGFLFNRNKTMSGVSTGMAPRLSTV